MRCKSEKTMEQIKNAVEEFYFSHYRSPSIGELAAEVGYAELAAGIQIPVRRADYL